MKTRSSPTLEFFPGEGITSIGRWGGVSEGLDCGV